MKKQNSQEFYDELANNWRHSQQEEEYAKELIESLGIKAEDRILDIACGDGIATEYEYELSKYPVTGIDLSPKMIEMAKNKVSKEKARFYVVDLFDFVEKGYDYAVMYNCYPHFLEPEKVSYKVASLLKEGGRLAILHSIGRNSLNHIHADKACEFSRQIGSPEEEAEFFSQNFKVIKTEEDDDHYMLILELK